MAAPWAFRREPPGSHVSKAGFRSTNRYEMEADHFASALLMPAKLFTAAAARAGDGIQAIEVLHAECETSIAGSANGSTRAGA